MFIDIFQKINLILNKHIAFHLKDFWIPIINILITIFYKSDISNFFDDNLFNKNLNKIIPYIKNCKMIDDLITNKEKILKKDMINYHGIEIGQYIFCERIINKKESIRILLIQLPKMFTFENYDKDITISNIKDLLILQIEKDLKETFKIFPFSFITQIFENNCLDLNNDTVLFENIILYNKESDTYTFKTNIEIENNEIFNLINNLSLNQNEDILNIINLIKSYLFEDNTKLDTEDIEELIDIYIDNDLIKNDLLKILENKNSLTKNIDINDFSLIEKIKKSRE
jgi:hypothetical protein